VAIVSTELMHLPSPDEQPITARLAGGGALCRELESLLAAAPPETTVPELRQLVLEQNASEKRSAAMRLETWWRLKVRYVLDPAIAEYRAFRQGLSAGAAADRSLIELLMLARNDRLFREVTLACVSPHLSRDGVGIETAAVDAAVRERIAALGLKWTPHTFDRTHKAILNTLKDFGILSGTDVRRTLRPRPGSQVTVFAAHLARLEGLTDRQTLEARWFRLLGLDRDRVVDLLYAAQRDGILGIRQQADVVELSLPALGAQ
jgi:hypothetical protein